MLHSAFKERLGVIAKPPLGRQLRWHRIQFQISTPLWRFLETEVHVQNKVTIRSIPYVAGGSERRRLRKQPVAADFSHCFAFLHKK